MAVTFLEIPSGVEGYRHVVRHVVENGRPRTPRGLKTLDAGRVITVIASPLDALPLGCGRNVNRAIAAAEAVQLIGAFSDPQLLTNASSAFEQFTEPDGTLHGAYGARVGYQLLGVVDRLRGDRDSRRAVINLWDGVRDFAPGKLDYPCTLVIGFEIEDDRLNVNVTMRSNDVWLGAAYDWFQFTQLQLTVADVLGVEPGEYRHDAWSLHIYEEHLDVADKLRSPGLHMREWQPVGLAASGFTSSTRSVFEVVDRARRLPYEWLDSMSESEMWYHEQLKTKRR